VIGRVAGSQAGQRSAAGVLWFYFMAFVAMSSSPERVR
jgi:hypothetical protein